MPAIAWACAVTRSWRLGPIGVRLALAFVAVALVAVAVVAGFTVAGTRSEVDDLAHRQRADQASAVAAAAAQAYQAAGGWPGADLDPALALAASAGANLEVRDATGTVVTANAAQQQLMRDLMDRMHGGMTTAETSQTGQTGQTAQGDPVTADVVVDGARAGTVALRYPASLAEPYQQVRDALLRVVLASAGLAALVALGAAMVVSRRITRPLAHLTRAAIAIEGGRRDTRVGLGNAPGELGELAVAFDHMADTLAREDELRRALVADVAHELRTPVTILQASCEEMVDGLAPASPERLASLHDEVLRLGRLVEDLEGLAAAQAAALRLDREPVDLAQVAAAAAESLAHRFADAGVTLRRDLEPAVVDGDAARLHQVVVNLLANAAKFTPDGGQVTLSTATDGALARLEVTDTGPGIAADELPHVFDRFWRGRETRTTGGSGIGLAVVAELVAAHEGRVEAASEPGRGARFTVLLPRP